MPAPLDLIGQTFGYLRVEALAPLGSKKVRSWRCSCTCGKTTIVQTGQLRTGNTKSCGCRGSRRAHEQALLFRCISCVEYLGLTAFAVDVSAANGRKATCRSCIRKAHERDPRYMIYHSAKKRARWLGRPFDLTIDDIDIPTTCPIFGMPLQTNRGYRSDSSPSLDAIIPSLGYVRGNIAVISWKANRKKNDLTPETLRRLLDYVERRGGSDDE